MRADDVQKQVDEAINKLIDDLPDILDQKALDAKAIIRNRFTQKGLIVNDSGLEESFPAYSPSYEAFKKRRYKPSTPNKLVLTGDMWRKINIIDRVKTKRTYKVVLGGLDDFSQNKIDMNSARYKDIFRVSNDESKLIIEVTTEEIINRFNTYINE